MGGFKVNTQPRPETPVSGPACRPGDDRRYCPEAEAASLMQLAIAFYQLGAPVPAATSGAAIPANRAAIAIGVW